MNRTTIPWVRNEDGTQGFTWNPITGCTNGCEYCYARSIAHRFGCSGKCEQRDGVVEATAESMPFPAGFAPTIYPNRLDEPLRRKKPATILLGSMGDLFDPAFPDGFRDRTMLIVKLAQRHTVLLLTKRPDVMIEYFIELYGNQRSEFYGGPIANLWLGVTVTNQQDADERIPLLLGTPAAHRFVSVEPMMGPVNMLLGGWLNALYGAGQIVPALDLVIVGGKTPGKPLHEQGFLQCRADDDTCSNCEPFGGDNALINLESLRDQCTEAGVPFLYKHGKLTPELDGVVHDELPWVVSP